MSTAKSLSESSHESGVFTSVTWGDIGKYSESKSLQADCKVSSLFTIRPAFHIYQHLKLELVRIPWGATIKWWWFLQVRCSSSGRLSEEWCKGMKSGAVGLRALTVLAFQTSVLSWVFVANHASSSLISSCMTAVLQLRGQLLLCSMQAF